MALLYYTKKMKKHIFIKVYLITMAFSIMSCANVENNQDYINEKGKLFIIGGGHRPDSLMIRMFEEAAFKNDDYAIVLPMSSSVPDSAIIWAKEQFHRIGIENVSGFNFLPGLENYDAAQIDSLKNASLIYISGGDQNRFMSIVKDTEIETAIHHAWNDGAMIAGTSAGAAVMSEKMITGDEKKHAEYRSTPRIVEVDNIELAGGLGFLKSSIVDQHFVWRSRYNRLLSLVIEYPDIMGIGIDESTAIIVEGDSAEVVGRSQVVVFRNPDNSKIIKEGKLGAKNLIIDLYLPGEKFSIN